MEISVGHTPDSDDAFMFYGMLSGKIRSNDFTIKHVIGDIEELNQKAVNPELDVTAVSVHACAYLPEYTKLLNRLATVSTGIYSAYKGKSWSFSVLSFFTIVFNLFNNGCCIIMSVTQKTILTLLACTILFI